MGEMIELTRPDGERCPAYLARPAAGDDAPGVVVVQEWWGLNAQIQRTADRMAEAGYRALVPDLYRGRLAKDAEEARHIMEGLDWGAATEQDLRGALQHLKANGKKAAVMGFCMGGALTILAAARISETDAGVCYYGIPPALAADPSTIKVPMLLHFATDDDWCNADAVAGLEERLQGGVVDYTLHRYEAKHAFMNDARPEVYAPEHAETAHARTLEFLAAQLG